MITLGVGKNIDMKELILMAKDRDHILRVENYDQLITLKPVIYQHAAFGKILFTQIFTSIIY